MCYMVIGKGGHGVVAVVIIRLESYVDPFFLPNGFGGFEEVLGQQLLLLVEIITSSLAVVSLRSLHAQQFVIQRQSECQVGHLATFSAARLNRVRHLSAATGPPRNTP